MGSSVTKMNHKADGKISGEFRRIEGLNLNSKMNNYRRSAEDITLSRE